MGVMTDVAYPERGGAALRYPAAGLALVSELIHLWVLPGQFVVAMLPGIFFLLVAISQGLLAVGGLDLAATAGEVALVILLVRLRRSLPPRKRKRRVRRSTRRDTVESEV